MESSNIDLILLATQFIIGLALIIWSADKFVFGATQLANKLNVSGAVIGATIVAIGTSLPEAFVSIIAAVKDQPQIALGNSIGSNIANIGFIFAACCICVPCVISVKPFYRDLIFLIISNIIASACLINLQLSRVSAIVLLMIFAVPLIYTVHQHKSEPTENTESSKYAILWIILGCILLPLSAHLIIDSCSKIARIFSINETTIGLTIMAFGTSLPELATCLVSMYKKQYNVAIGNIIGSNIFNVTLVLGLTAVITPFSFEQYVISRDIPFMFGISLVFILSLFNKKLSRTTGVMTFLAYLGYFYCTLA